MATFMIFGRADSAAFAQAERLGHILEVTLPYATIDVVSVVPEDWERVYSKLSERFDAAKLEVGGMIPHSFVVDPLSNMVIGDSTAFSREIQSRHGIVIDISTTQLELIAGSNHQFASTTADTLDSAFQSFNSITGRPLHN